MDGVNLKIIDRARAPTGYVLAVYFIGREAVIYLNRGKAMKATGGFPAFNFCYNLERIKEQVIYAKEYECKPPYNTEVRERKFKFVYGKIKLIN
jgi:hypothetical protein